MSSPNELIDPIIQAYQKDEITYDEAVKRIVALLNSNGWENIAPVVELDLRSAHVLKKNHERGKEHV